MTTTPDGSDAAEASADAVSPASAEKASDQRAGGPAQGIRSWVRVDTAGRPTPVRYAFVVWVLAGMFGMINAIILLANKQRLIDNWVRTKSADVSDDQIARGATTLLWMFMLAAIVFALLFTLFAYKAQDGVRRARLSLTVLCLVTVAFYFLVLPTQFGLMTALLALVATVLLYLPRSNVYFRPRDLPT